MNIDDAMQSIFVQPSKGGLLTRLAIVWHVILGRPLIYRSKFHSLELATTNRKLLVINNWVFPRKTVKPAFGGKTLIELS